MNPLNCATLEASQRLVEAGIAMETDMCWYPSKLGGYLLKQEGWKSRDQIPAPSMGEIWRGLPAYLNSNSYNHERRVPLSVERGITGNTIARYEFDKSCENTNPTDALIDLLIWVREEPVN